MPLPASLIASIVSAVIEAAGQTTTANTTQYDNYTTTRTLPPEVKQGVMFPPPGDGTVVIDGTKLKLSPTVQFRNQRNLIIMPMTIQNSSDVVYLPDTSGAVHRVWMVSAAELSDLPKN